MYGACMYLSYLKVQNFKGMGCFHNEMHFAIPDMRTPGSGLNILVGENNSGKSTIFEAIDFLRNGTKSKMADLKNKSAEQIAPMFVEGEFVGDVNSVIESFIVPNKKKALSDQVFKKDGVESLRIKRSSVDEGKSLVVYSPEIEDFKNVAGIDAPIKQLYENNFIWADTNPSEEAKFGATTLCGVLLKEIAKASVTSPDYQEFTESFHQFFNANDSDLRRRLLTIEQKMTSIFSSQFGEAKLRFHFDELTVDSFFKNSTILVDDGVEVPMGQEGQGMQRSIALALLQVYADIIVQRAEAARSKPFFLFIDEPELSLHPAGQYTLLNALLSLSKTQQIFITCHSPIFLQNPQIKNSRIFFFKKIASFNQIDTVESLDLFPWSPSWGEIVYKAYKLPTSEFHNELYGYLETLLNDTKVNNYLNQKFNIPMSYTRIRSDNVCWNNLTLPVYLRHEIHHPETNGKNPYTTEDLDKSIEILIQAIKARRKEMSESSR